MSIREAYRASVYADSIGVLQQKILLEKSFCVRQSATASKPPKVLQETSMSLSTTAAVMCSEINWLTSLRALSQVKGLTPATRHSQRLQKVDAENIGLVNFPDDSNLRQGEKSSCQAEAKLRKVQSEKSSSQAEVKSARAARLQISKHTYCSHLKCLNDQELQNFHDQRFMPSSCI